MLKAILLICTAMWAAGLGALFQVFVGGTAQLWATSQHLLTPWCSAALALLRPIVG
jgi:hypothetical protein